MNAFILGKFCKGHKSIMNVRTNIAFYAQNQYIMPHVFLVQCLSNVPCKQGSLYVDSASLATSSFASVSPIHVCAPYIHSSFFMSRF